MDDAEQLEIWAKDSRISDARSEVSKHGNNAHEWQKRLARLPLSTEKEPPLHDSSNNHAY